MTQISLFDNAEAAPPHTHTPDFSLKSPDQLSYELNPGLSYTINPDGWSVKGCSIIYAPSGQAGEYAKLATNPYRGCGHKCVYCATGDTLILMANGSTKPLESINIGDKIVGIIREDRDGGAWSHRYKFTDVLAKIETFKPAYRITLENGVTLTCSGDHRWLTDRGWKYVTGTEQGNERRPFLTVNNHIRGIGPVTKSLVVTDDYRRGYLSGIIRGDGLFKHYPHLRQYHFRLALKDFAALDRTADYLHYFGVDTHRTRFSNGDNPNRSPMQMIQNQSRHGYETITKLIESSNHPEWQRGWLSGIFDAEGSFSGSIRISNNDPDIIATTMVALDNFGFAHIHEQRIGHVDSIRITGGLPENSRFFQVVDPSIERKFSIEGDAVTANFKVVDITPCNESLPMYDITTGTENFIANGMVSHNCYVPEKVIANLSRAEFDAGAVPREGYLKKLTADARKYQACGITEQVMLSFTTDPFHPGDTDLTHHTLQILQHYGMGICTLTKGGSRALRDLYMFRPDRDAFASTLTSLDDAFSARWESGAAPASDRIATLRKFHEAGIFTWVSLEPTLSMNASLAIIRECHGFVDLFKIGRANYIKTPEPIDWQEYTLRAIDLCQRLKVQHYIKKDLQGYLPPAYHNPRYVEQHH